MELLSFHSIKDTVQNNLAELAAPVFFFCSLAILLLQMFPRTSNLRSAPTHILPASTSGGWATHLLYLQGAASHLEPLEPAATAGPWPSLFARAVERLGQARKGGDGWVRGIRGWVCSRVTSQPLGFSMPRHSMGLP